MRTLPVLIASGGLVASAMAASMMFSSFLGADAGAPVSFQPVFLPPVAVATGGLGQIHSGPFGPSLETLLNGEVVIETDAQMRAVWKRLFATPYNPSLFDFQTSFVVLMGSGVLPGDASFSISDVEVATGHYSNVGGPGGNPADDPFLVVTSTTFFPGVQSQDPPPPAVQVSAVRVDNSERDDVVFHRAVILGV